MSRIAGITVLSIALAAFAGCSRSKPQEALAPSLIETTRLSPGAVTAEIRVAPNQLEPNQPYTVSYLVSNGLKFPLSVNRVQTNLGTLAKGVQGWQQSAVEPGRTVLIAQTMGKALTPGTESFSATFVTDRGSYDAPLVRIPISGAKATASPDRVIGVVSVSRTEVVTSEPVTVTYDLIDSTSADLVMLSIDIDSSAPLSADYSGWQTDKVPAGGRRTIARRTVVKTEPGSYEFRARFNTSRGSYTAAPVTVTVKSPVREDTGHVTGRIAISPNPCPIDARYTIEYQVVNTTLKDVAISSVGTDIGNYVPGSPEWLSGTATAERTTTIARLNGTGSAATSRTKRARFDTANGSVEAPSVLFIVE